MRKIAAVVFVALVLAGCGNDHPRTEPSGPFFEVMSTPLDLFSTILDEE